MISHPPILALVLASLISSLTLVWAAWFALQVVRNWRTESGHAAQITMEKRTYLVSTALVFVLVLEVASLLLFVSNADKMSVMFVGAMCAVGTLNVNDYGMPALMLKLALFFGALVWLIINYVDNKGRDYPLTKFKYTILIALAPLVVVAAGTQLLYFLDLKTDVITSCCSRLFVPEGGGVEASLSGMNPKLALWLLFAGLAVVVIMALMSIRIRFMQKLYGIASAVFFVISITAIVSVISSYIYEQPFHHCPFDIIKPEYNYIGYAIYIPLFTATGFGMAASLLAWRKTPQSLAGSYMSILRRQILFSALLFVIFVTVSLYAIMSSHLVMF